MHNIEYAPRVLPLLFAIGEMAKTRPGGFSLAVYSLLGIYTSFFGYGLLYVPYYVPYGV